MHQVQSDEPRIIYVADDFVASREAVVGYRADNVLMKLNTRKWRFADEAPEVPWHTTKAIVVPIERCRRYDDPLAWMEALTNTDIIEFELDCKAKSTQRRFPWINPEWFALRIGFHHHTRLNNLSVYFFDNNVPRHVNTVTDTYYVERLNSQYAFEMVPRGFLYIDSESAEKKSVFCHKSVQHPGSLL